MDVITLALSKKYTDTKIAEAAVGGVDVTELVNSRVDAVIGNASEKFDTLGELETEVKNKVDKTTTINKKALSGNITLNATDIGALPNTTKIPATLADLSGDTTHRVVTDTEKASWNAKSTFSGDYNDLANKPTIPSISGLTTETYVDNAVANIILTSEGGKKFKLTVDDTGTLTATEVTE